MLSKQEIKWVKSLQDKQNRETEILFSAEGSRLVLDLIRDNPANLHQLYATNEWISKNGPKIQLFNDKIKQVSAEDLNRLALLKSTEEVIGIFHYPRFEFAHKRDLNFTLYLCDIKDPGNLGTIIRTADWFGVSQLFATKGTVDFLNNKVIQATMSSISRIQITTINPLELKQLLPDFEWYGTTLDGIPIEQVPKTSLGIICLGNEANGLPEDIRSMCTSNIFIAGNTLGAESLNVAVAAGILLNHFKSPG